MSDTISCSYDLFISLTIHSFDDFTFLKNLICLDLLALWYYVNLIFPILKLIPENNISSISIYHFCSTLCFLIIISVFYNKKRGDFNNYILNNRISRFGFRNFLKEYYNENKYRIYLKIAFYAGKTYPII